MGTILHLTNSDTVTVEGTVDDVAKQLGKPDSWVKLEVEGGGGESVVVAVSHVTHLTDATMRVVDATMRVVDV